MLRPGARPCSSNARPPSKRSFDESPRPPEGAQGKASAETACSATQRLRLDRDPRAVRVQAECCQATRTDTPSENQETDMPTVTELGQTGLQGWREKVADGISQPVANRAPLEEDQVRAVIGAAFFVLAVIYVAKTISAATRQARRG